VPTDKDLYISFVKYKLNPYMATPEFRKIAGPYAIDSSFPLYAPYLQVVGDTNSIVTPQGFTLYFDFIVPNETLKVIQQYTCA
jgi:hypothetical protein